MTGPDTSTLVGPETTAALTVLVKAIEARDPYTAGHTWRVSRYVLDMARRIGWPETRCREAELGSMLHDLGKLKVRDDILNKHGPLTPDEFRLIQGHPAAGGDIVRLVPSLRPLLPYIEAHHEHFDGGGYPGRLAGDAIPLAGRLVAVADAFDAMTSTRPYRSALSAEYALSELQRHRGSQFDPELVDVFVEAWNAGDFSQVAGFSNTNLPLLPCRLCGPIVEIPDTATQTGQSGPLQCPSCGGLYRAVYVNGQWAIEAPAGA